MESKSKISIVVPVYNVEKYLQQCLDSILAQTYTEFELIIVDDGSFDGSSALISDYKQKDKRIITITQCNQGLSEARNVGMRIATGEYICFIDSDDWIATNYLEEMIKEAIKENAEIVSVSNYNVDQNGNTKKYERENKIFKQKSADALFGMFDTNYAWGKLIRRSIFQDIEFPKGRRYEDIGTMYKLFLKSDCVVLTNKTQYYYRYRTDSITGNRRESDVKDKIEFITNMNKTEISECYLFWDFYRLNKAFGAMADIYKINNLNKDMKKKYIKEIYNLTSNYSLDLNCLKANGSILRAILMKTRFAHIFLELKYGKGIWRII